MSKYRIGRNRLDALAADWFQLLGLLRTYDDNPKHPPPGVLEAEISFSRLTDAIAAALEERGISSGSLHELRHARPHATDAQWDAALLAVERAQARSRIEDPKDVAPPIPDYLIQRLDDLAGALAMPQDDHRSFNLRVLGAIEAVDREAIVYGLMQGPVAFLHIHHEWRVDGPPHFEHFLIGYGVSAAHRGGDTTPIFQKLLSSTRAAADGDVTEEFELTKAERTSVLKIVRGWRGHVAGDDTDGEDHAIPGARRKPPSPSRERAKEIYDLMMNSIPDAKYLSIEELYHKAKEEMERLADIAVGEQSEKIHDWLKAMPPKWETWAKYLRDAGVKKRYTSGSAHTTRIVIPKRLSD